MTAICRRAPIFLLALLLWLCSGLPVQAHHVAQHAPDWLQQVGLEQRLHEYIPLDLAFVDETGKPVHLRDYFGGKPVILTLAYYDCPNLCTLVLNGLLKALRPLSLTVGTHFNVLTVSINPADTPALAAVAPKTRWARSTSPPRIVTVG